MTARDHILAVLSEVPAASVALRCPEIHDRLMTRLTLTAWQKRWWGFWGHSQWYPLLRHLEREGLVRAEKLEKQWAPGRHLVGWRLVRGDA